MTFVEQIHPGFQWAEPLHGNELEVEWIGSDLQITGLVPSYKAKDSPCDLIHQYEKFPKQLATGQRNGTESPGVHFANANTDEKLIAFVRGFGPVVAKSVKDTRMIPDKELGEPRLPGRLIARQDIHELRNEQAVYRAALAAVMQLRQPNYDHASAQQLIKIIVTNIEDWPRQWKHERSMRGVVPNWRLSDESLKRIAGLSSAPPDKITARVIICELLNSFPGTVFPNPLEMHSSIKFGIRPLLYSLLRRQFIYPREFSICANVECRNFFNIDRTGQQFCSPECSLRQRQRDYWQKRGRKLRKKRVAQRRKAHK